MKMNLKRQMLKSIFIPTLCYHGENFFSSILPSKKANTISSRLSDSLSLHLSVSFFVILSVSMFLCLIHSVAASLHTSPCLSLSLFLSSSHLFLSRNPLSSVCMSPTLLPYVYVRTASTRAHDLLFQKVVSWLLTTGSQTCKAVFPCSVTELFVSLLVVIHFKNSVIITRESR